VISEQTLQRLESLSRHCDPVPWRASVEGRDHVSGDSFIMTGDDNRRGEDIYVTRDSGPAGAEYLDFIAEACTWLPVLIAEVREARRR